MSLLHWLINLFTNKTKKILSGVQKRMSLKQLSTTVVAITFGACTFAAQANDQASHNWMPKQPTNHYWQAPNWSFNTPPPQNTAPPAPVYNNNAQRQRPVALPPQAYQRPPAYYPQNRNRYAPPPPPAGPYNGVPMPQPNPYRGAPPPYNPGYNGPSAFYTPGYNPYRRNSNGWNNNRFWGRSGPSTWMNPSKRNWENSWDDMINAPSRMGEMPGGWTAPEITMPNPIDMGDQFQDNLKDLPEQMRDMNVGNDVRD